MRNDTTPRDLLATASAVFESLTPETPFGHLPYYNVDPSRIVNGMLGCIYGGGDLGQSPPTSKVRPKRRDYANADSIILSVMNLTLGSFINELTNLENEQLAFVTKTRTSGQDVNQAAGCLLLHYTAARDSYSIELEKRFVPDSGWILRPGGVGDFIVTKLLTTPRRHWINTQGGKYVTDSKPNVFNDRDFYRHYDSSPVRFTNMFITDIGDVVFIQSSTIMSDISMVSDDKKEQFFKSQQELHSMTPGTTTILPLRQCRHVISSIVPDGMYTTVEMVE